MKITPLKLLLFGLIIVVIGAVFRIFKINYSITIIQIGLIIELCSGLFYLIKRFSKKFV